MGTRAGRSSVRGLGVVALAAWLHAGCSGSVSAVGHGDGGTRDATSSSGSGSSGGSSSGGGSGSSSGSSSASSSGADSGSDAGEASTVDAAGCGSGLSPCARQCVDLQSDPDHCGACNTPCDDSGVCSQGQCTLSCSTGFKPCFASDTCIPTTTCCTSAECTVMGEVCTMPGGTCGCPAGDRTCPSIAACIGAGACCTSADCQDAGLSCPTPGQPCR